MIKIHAKLKGIGYAETITGRDCNELDEESFMKRLISMFIPLILQATPPNFLKCDSDGVKILWESKKHSPFLSILNFQIY